MKIVMDILRIVAAMIPIVIGVEEAGNGDVKRQRAIEIAKTVLAEPGGIDIPPFLVPYQDWFFGLVVDMIVMLLNRNSCLDSPAEPAKSVTTPAALTREDLLKNR